MRRVSLSKSDRRAAPGDGSPIWGSVAPRRESSRAARPVLPRASAAEHEHPRRRSGHRIFRIDAHPYLVGPRRLSTNGAVLEVHCAERTVLVDLTHALLLDFVMWSDSPALAAQRVSAWLT